MSEAVAQFDDGLCATQKNRSGFQIQATIQIFQCTWNFLRLVSFTSGCFDTNEIRGLV